MNNEWRELKTLQDVAAAMDYGDEIEVLNIANKCYWKWDGQCWDQYWSFRARPRQPKMKKVKSLCWRQASTGDLTWTDEGTGFVTESEWRRFPAGDIEGEVEE